MSEKPPTKLSHPQSPSYSAVQSKGVTGKGASGPKGSSPDGPLQTFDDLSKVQREIMARALVGAWARLGRRSPNV